jgi:hypothetical protein
MGQVKEALPQTITRRLDESQLELGDPVLIKEGVVGSLLPATGRLVQQTKFITLWS